MKLALLVEYYPPSRASAAVQMSELARSFSRSGHQVTVFTTSPNVTRDAMVESVDGVRVVRVRTAKAKGIGLARRAISEILMSFALLRGARTCAVKLDAFDSIIWYSPTIFLAPFVAWLKFRSGAPAYLILRDIFPQWALDAGILRPGPAYYFFRLAERFQYSVADVVGAQSPANVTHVQLDVPRKLVEVLFNWVDLDRPAPSVSNVLEQCGLVGMRVLVYGGNVGLAQDPDNMIRLAENLKRERSIALLILGAGSEVGRLKREVLERELTNVVILDEVDPEAFRAILRQCSAGLITLDRRLTTHNIPGKLLAYLEAGLPVVASVNPGNDLISMLHDSGAGIAFVNGQDAQFAEGARQLVLDSGRCAEMSKRARVLVHERFSLNSIADQLLDSLARHQGRKAVSEMT